MADIDTSEPRLDVFREKDGKWVGDFPVELVNGKPHVRCNGDVYKLVPYENGDRQGSFYLENPKDAKNLERFRHY